MGVSSPRAWDVTVSIDITCDETNKQIKRKRGRDWGLVAGVRSQPEERNCRQKKKVKGEEETGTR